MRRQIHLSLLVALLLTLGPVSGFISSRAADTGVGGAAAFVAVSATADEAGSEKKKGGGFARAIGAPFRALGRLFGGGKKKDEAKQKPRADEPVAATAHTAVVVVKAPRRKKVKEERRKEQAAQQTTAAEQKAAPAPSVVSVAQGAPAFVESPAPGGGDVAAAAAVSPAAVARVVRPAEGQPVQPAPPKWIPVIEGIGRDPLTQGRALLQHGYPNEAISELSIAAVTGPDLVEANNLLGLAYDHLGLRRQAIAAYERALSAAPDDPQVLNNLGYSLSLDGRPVEALKRLKQAERQAPGAPHVLRNIAFVQARLGKYGDAFKTLARAFGEYDARLKTAELLEQANRADDALKHYEAALKLQPDSPALLERLLAIYERKGRTREADAARRALSNPPNKQKTATGGGG